MTGPLRLPPGVWLDVPHDAYHADCAECPSLSSSVAKILISETPMAAMLAHPRLNLGFEAEHDSKFDLGSAVHDILASQGKRVEVVEGFDDWKKGDARKKRDEIRAAGKVPLLTEQWDRAHAIVEVVWVGLAKAAVDLGWQEAVAVVKDGDVWLRAMFDGFSNVTITDFKVTGVNLANDTALARHMVDLGYDLRAAFYLHVAELAFPELAGRLKFRWVFVQVDPPHGIRIIEADGTWREMGRRKMAHAIAVWHDCVATGKWPHLEGLPTRIEYPGWSENEWLQREQRLGFVQGPMVTLKAFDDEDQE